MKCHCINKCKVSIIDFTAPWGIRQVLQRSVLVGLFSFKAPTYCRIMQWCTMI